MSTPTQAIVVTTINDGRFIPAYLSNLRDDRIVPWNTDNRHNVGYLMALRDGAEVLISIDDDNLPCPGQDFIGGHAVTGRDIEAVELSSSSGWYNLFDALDAVPAIPMWPRGHRYRWSRTV